MPPRQSERLTEALVRPDTTLQRRPQSGQAAVNRRIGRTPGRHPAAAAVVQAVVIRDAADRAGVLVTASTVSAG